MRNCNLVYNETQNLSIYLASFPIIAWKEDQQYESTWQKGAFPSISLIFQEKILTCKIYSSA